MSALCWSPVTDQVVVASNDRNVQIYDAAARRIVKTFSRTYYDEVLSADWMAQGRFLALGISDRTIQIWDTDAGRIVKTLREHANGVSCVAWSPSGMHIAAGSRDSTILIWEMDHWTLTSPPLWHRNGVTSISWAPDGRRLAASAWDGRVRLWSLSELNVPVTLEGHTSAFVNSVSWSPNGTVLASGSSDRTIRIWDAETGRTLQVVEGHTSDVLSVAFSADGNLLCSQAREGHLCLWRTDSWDLVAKIPRTDEASSVPCKLSVSGNFLAVPEDGNGLLRFWSVDQARLFGTAPTARNHLTTAKVVLVGESNVGKSCLALRLAENRFESLGATHAMRIWRTTPHQLTRTTQPDNKNLEIVLWDLGGHDEYRLVHQLFLRDTTVAMILFDPTRGQNSFDEARAWSKRLDRQAGRAPMVRFLVGAKVDDDDTPIDEAAIGVLVKECGFSAYFPTSALTGKGTAELCAALLASINWNVLSRTSRPELFQKIRDEIDNARKSGETVLLIPELEQRIKDSQRGSYDRRAVGAVVNQLSLQGVLAQTRLRSDQSALVLDIALIERYAGSLILLARGNPAGVPCIQQDRIVAADMAFPGIRDRERPERRSELFVLDCVLQLLLEHGLCLHHKGLLIFPSLFRYAAPSKDKSATYVSSTRYDFAGAVDNVYSSLIAWLATSGHFGQYRLSEDRAEFQNSPGDISGIRRLNRGPGYARLEVFFSRETSQGTRDLFVTFVDDHLKGYGIDVLEGFDLACVACGFRFDDDSVRARLDSGKPDIGCPTCDHRVFISRGAEDARQRSDSLAGKLWALRSSIDSGKAVAVEHVRRAFVDAELRTGPRVRILHLSDLHFGDGDVRGLIQPLLADIKDMGIARIDYLVASGDLTRRAASIEFQTAYRFVSALVDELRISADRCIVVPGNHDVDWNELTYDWRRERQLLASDLVDGTYIRQEKGFLVRNENWESGRFRAFSKHFYHPLMQRPYPERVSEQCEVLTFPQDGLQFIGLNSAWNLDEYFPSRTGINEAALSRALERADLEKTSYPIRRIVVLHHPVSGNEKIPDDAFVSRLAQAGVGMCLHGHIHEERADILGNWSPHGRVVSVGAGTFGAVAKDRPESTPCLYNVVELTRLGSTVQVNTRCRRRDGGAWEGWAVWPSKDPQQRATFFEVEWPIRGPSKEEY
jgi:small GTP-binding protein